MNRVLVTGGAGFIGSHLVEALAPHVEYLAVLDDLSTGREANIPGARLWVGDVAREGIVAEAAMEAKPDVIFHLAAQTSVAASMSDMIGDAEVNVMGSLHVLRAANQHGSRVIFASTGGAMYGDCTHAADEKTTIRSIAPYAVSKYSAEAYLAAANRYRDFRNRGRQDAPLAPGHVSLRLANVYGPRQRSDGEAGVVSIFMRQALNSTRMIVHGAGAQTRDFVYVTDAVAAFWAVAQHPELDGVFNVGTGVETRIDALARLVAETVGVPARVEHVEPRRGDLQRSFLHAGKLHDATGWTPHTRVQAGLRRTAAWMTELAEVGP